MSQMATLNPLSISHGGVRTTTTSLVNGSCSAMAIQAERPRTRWNAHGDWRERKGMVVLANNILSGSTPLAKSVVM